MEDLTNDKITELIEQIPLNLEVIIRNMDLYNNRGKFNSLVEAFLESNIKKVTIYISLVNCANLGLYDYIRL